jgi:type I restriction enzyme S subunit
MIPHFKKGDFFRLKIPMPQRAMQVAIGSWYMEISRKIDLNRRMNETLEAMARTIFQDWFVTFGPTRAKQEGRPPYLAPDLRSLFPNRLDDDGKPEGWLRGTLLDLCQLKRGYDLPTSQRVTGPFPIISSSGVTDFHDRAMVNGPGVVTGRYGTIGEVFFVEGAFWPLNTALYVADFRWNSRRFVFYTLRLLDFRQYSDKGAVPGVNRNDLHRAPVILPPPLVQQAFERTLAPSWERIAANERESETLAAVRDLLLPKLMSGELRVKDAECAVAEVA